MKCLQSIGIGLAIVVVFAAGIAFDTWLHFGRFNDCRTAGHTTIVCVIRAL
jgi:hypothetical protein